MAGNAAPLLLNFPIAELRSGYPTTMFALAWQTLVNQIGAKAVTVSLLPDAAAAVAQRAFVSDSTVAAAGNFGAVAAGGGTHVVPVYSDGAAWRIG